tara:strand:+ start:3096 stop:3551 length:456 start_codon:yes stop_codon:yes gene_type:complete
MNELDFRNFRFGLEEVARSERLAGHTLEVLQDESRREIIVHMARRIPVAREMFESQCRPPVVRTSVRHVTVELNVALTWWDMAKREIGFLSWLAEHRILKRGKLVCQSKTESVETRRVESHYIEAITILDDEKQLPEHLRTREVQWLEDGI